MAPAVVAMDLASLASVRPAARRVLDARLAIDVLINNAGLAGLRGQTTPVQHVIKGGSFLCAPNYCRRYRAAARQPQDESLATSHLGFRTVRLAPGPTP